MAEYTPAGRPSAFTLPNGVSAADLIVILQNFANDTVNVHGDEMTGDYTITGTVDATGMAYAGTAGQLVTICTSGTRPSVGADYPVIYETDTNLVLGWDGAAYAAIAGSGGSGYSSRFLLMGA